VKHIHTDQRITGISFLQNATSYDLGNDIIIAVFNFLRQCPVVGSRKQCRSLRGFRTNSVRAPLNAETFRLVHSTFMKSTTPTAESNYPE